jgi:glycosyltransferase involved in cell wall biosynthesis
VSALLIILPRGLGVSGVTTWALGLAGGLAARGRRVGILAPRGMGATGAPAIPPGAQAFLPERLPIDDLRGDLTPILPAYRAAIEALSGAGPVVVSPNLHGDCYGAVVEIALARRDVRIVGWQHSDIAYDTHVLRWYGAALSRVVAVSGRIEERLRRAGDGWPRGWRDTPRLAPVSLIPYGVEIPQVAPARAAPARRALRLLYAGRLDHEQKRVGALEPMMQELAAAGIGARLTIAGDGPALGEIEAACGRRADMEAIGAVTPDRVVALLEAADCLVLPSRYEGLSVAMLEAMAHGCVPVVARIDSGLEDAVRDGASAVIADAGPEDDVEQAGIAMARGVERAIEIGLERLGAGARAAAEGFGLTRHMDRVEAMLDEVAAGPPGKWPADRPAAFSAWDPRYGSGSVPPDGPERFARALDALAGAGARVAIHGAGEHTRRLGQALEARLESVVCFCDDSPRVWGGTQCGRPVVAPSSAGELGATHVVISSWLHEGEVWRRRGVYEGQGIGVVRLYAAEGEEAVRRCAGRPVRGD